MTSQPPASPPSSYDFVPLPDRAPLKFPGGAHVALIFTIVNDFNMFARGGLSTRDGLDMLRLCFDQLHAEGTQSGRIMNVGLHPHVIGQPHRIAALREFIAYVKGQRGVWLPTREEIARWYLSEAAGHMKRQRR